MHTYLILSQAPNSHKKKDMPRTLLVQSNKKAPLSIQSGANNLIFELNHVIKECSSLFYSFTATQHTEVVLRHGLS